MKKLISRGIDLVAHIIKLRCENPITIWKKYGKPYFKFPKVSFSLYIREKCDRKYYNPGLLIDIVSQDIEWKSKYGMLEYERSPFIRLTLFTWIVFQIELVAPADNNLYDDICYWEGLLIMMSCTDSNTGEWTTSSDDALLKAYNDNIWTDMEGTSFTIEPYLTNLGWHILQSKRGRLV